MHVKQRSQNLDWSMLYTAKEAHVVMRWCDMSTSDIADCLRVSPKKARLLKKHPGTLRMGQISKLAASMGKESALLVKELIWCDAPSLADELDI
ncbi:hypothetical protein [uncultured Bifidobacterium sp.]|uniref:hypothetical protein n=1 Tax=uncultured Bifidobacterium sp. TaxID=165187 RepID=UPI00259466EF|nr:hypothetical protein [uncultured Bifidobacterium sp.]